MSEMGDWIAQMFSDGMLTRPGGENVGTPPPAPVTEPPAPDMNRPDPTVPPPAAGAPTYPGAPPWAGDPNVPAPLAGYLRWRDSGHNILSDEMYNYFGGDSLLDAIRQYDPNAAYQDTDLYGGEGGSGGGHGRMLNYDISKLPAAVGPGWTRATGPEDDKLIHPEMRYYDPNYGWVTDPRNVHHYSEGIDRWAPYIGAAISMGGPALGAALAGAGIGAGVGGTAAVTGGAAGLGASNIAMGGTPTWWSQWLAKAPRTVGPILSGAPSAPSTNPPPVRPPIPRAAALPDSYGFDPTAYNSSGSSAKPQSNDSKMVATQFADDPYRFSGG